ncbi:hypothetical protein [Halomonas rhizosphaerae]|uniref:Uncharacterized protein n=1 Tax=Halomonas rhizosphaerae TaxID=3043296 RepID=A0ABT6UXD6_9GAMM|nr:hypothetical protein [Halomonas rhizosphaerae]MDI5890635.1 hypothetical protein [Halomonas rhizosphaerae]
MAQKGIIAAIKDQGGIAPEQGGELIIPDGFLTPGFIATATCLGHVRGITRLTYRNPDLHERYFEAMQVPYLLTGVDGYHLVRTNQGTNYSPMQLLETADDVDKATSETSNCILRQVGDDLPGIRNLCDVIGELHDNVRAHADGVGYSMAQNWRYMGRELVIEFAITDAGQGFLRECQRTAVPGVTDDETAIRWCLEPRHSTKDVEVDEFAQQQPEDAIGNPFGDAPDVYVRHDGNHHQGLGLAKLVELTRAYSGTLWVASGQAVLISNPHTRDAVSVGNFVAVPHWQGVAIACRLQISELGKPIEEEPLQDDVQNLLGDILI